MPQFQTSTFRLLAAMLFASISTAICAQSFPFPYNPDENGDGLIGVADLQGLLSAYGSEFSSVVLSEDSSVALYHAGTMPYFQCLGTCASLTGRWELISPSSVGQALEEIVPNNQYGYYQDDFGDDKIPLFKGDGVVAWESWSNAGLERHCICETRQLPKVEYSHCSGGAPSEVAFNQCISEKLAEGWYPLSGFPSMRDQQGYIGDNDGWNNAYSPQSHASFWRWEH